MERDRWLEYLHGRHSPAELRAWATSLAYFRFCRAYGGHANDGDRLLVSLRTETEADLLAVMSALGLAAVRLPADNPRPVEGVGYSAAEFAAFVPPMPRFPHFAQPGHVLIAGRPAHVWSAAETLSLSLNDERDVYEVTDATVESAKVIERLLAPVAARVVDPPQDSRHCVCPRYYPEFWAS
ncbi:hypothetical protein AB0B45_10630 [Nonomuraea sp. NPDC049152]|uniref:hypothetical protein n=1 Tax=Nonomuraea sp. NPDC049152 TaxID=3154350 RepID=UPI0033DED423